MADRRSVVAGIALAPVAIAIPAAALTPQPSSAEFDAALAKWQRAHKALCDHPCAETFFDDPEYDRLEREQSALCDVEIEALHALMETPAPDHASLLRKLDIIRRESFDVPFIEPLMADVRALAT